MTVPHTTRIPSTLLYAPCATGDVESQRSIDTNSVPVVVQTSLPAIKSEASSGRQPLGVQLRDALPSPRAAGRSCAQVAVTAGVGLASATASGLLGAFVGTGGGAIVGALSAILLNASNRDADTIMQTGAIWGARTCAVIAAAIGGAIAGTSAWKKIRTWAQ